MLVDADPVEAELGGELELVEELVVEHMPAARIEQLRIDVDPHPRMAFGEVVGQIRPRHQVKRAELHWRVVPKGLSRHVADLATTRKRVMERGTMKGSRVPVLYRPTSAPCRGSSSWSRRSAAPSPRRSRIRDLPGPIRSRSR